MPLIAYTPKKFNAEHSSIIQQANTIIDDYAKQGFDLTLRQLYYQFIGRDLFPAKWADPKTGSTNNVRSYKKLGTIISDARRAGQVDWNRIVDRTRYVRQPSHWTSPAQLVAACADQFDVDWWGDQDYRPEVWVEKDALIGVLEVACEQWHCPYFSCRGYTSDSDAWKAANRMDKALKEGKTPIIFHLGDHDPSGMDMSRDITDRINLFSREASKVEVRRLALNMDQIEELRPPPNPAKETDARFSKYQDKYGDESWELDALDPTAISDVIATAMNELIVQTAWTACEEERDEGRRLLGAVSDRWDKITDKL